MHKILSISMITALFFALLCSDLSAHDSISWFIAEDLDECFCGSNFAATTYALTIAAASMSIYNDNALRVGNPSTFSGLFGTLSGAFVIVYGGTILVSGDNRSITIGIFVTAVGITSLCYGAKSLNEARAKRIDNKKQTLSIDPVIGTTDHRRTEVDIQIRFEL